MDYLEEVSQLVVDRFRDNNNLALFIWNNKDGAESTAELEQYSAKLNATADFAERKLIIKEFLEKWGGIYTNSEMALSNYAKLSASDWVNLPYEGISSWSKILTLIDRARFVVYDSRVAFSINAIIYLSGIESKKYFHVPEGRNKKIELVENLIVFENLRAKGDFSQESEFPNNLTAWEGKFCKKQQTYANYLKLLELVHIQLPDMRPHEIEMALFANAETFAFEIAKTIADNIEFNTRISELRQKAKSLGYASCEGLVTNAEGKIVQGADAYAHDLERAELAEKTDLAKQ